MTVNRSKTFAAGAVLCNAGLFFIGLGLVAQIFSHVFYTLPNDRIFYLGSAFILTFILMRALRTMSRQPGLSGSSAMAYPDIAAVKLRR